MAARENEYGAKAWQASAKQQWQWRNGGGVIVVCMAAYRGVVARMAYRGNGGGGKAWRNGGR